MPTSGNGIHRGCMKIDVGDGMLTKEMIDELVNGLCTIFSEQIKQIILYGSVARNEAIPESDIDIAVILDGDASEDRRDQFLSFCAELDLKYDRVFSIIDINQRMMEKWYAIVPFYRNIQKDGVVLWKAA